MKLASHVCSSARSVARSAAITGLFAALAMTGFTIASANPEAVVARSFSAALEASRPTDAPSKSGTLISGTEEFWLAEKRRMAEGVALEPAAWPGQTTPFALSPGERITIGSGSSQRVLEVVSIKETPADHGNAATVEIVARDSADASSPLITFTTAIEKSGKAGTKTARAL